MRWIRTIASEVLGLFVDDGSYAIAILVWLAVAGVLLPLVDLARAAKGPILFAGLAAILVASAVRSSRK